MEQGGLVLYCKILDAGTFLRPDNLSGGKMTWRDLVMMVEGIVENLTYRRKRIKFLRDK